MADKKSSGDENVQRGNWSNKMDFLLSCVGYAVGLGNVWRFPYLTYQNGGGAFLIPYFIMLVLAGLPIFFMEVSFGQYCSQGPLTAWRAIPMMRGVGYGMMIVSAYVGIYYNVIIMYTIYYLFASFTKKLPWVGCANEWNTKLCSILFTDCINAGGIVNNTNDCVELTTLSEEELDYYNVTTNPDGSYNISDYTDPYFSDRRLPSEEYWKEAVLHEADSMNETGKVIWELALCLLLAWIIIFLCLFKGIKSSGKVVYFTATFPYLVLIVLLIRGVTLPGYFKGIQFYITPRWETLSNPRVWLDAAVQIFYSLSAAWGGLLTLASYNKFHNNTYFDSMFVATINCATSLFAGFVIFSILGFMAHELGVEVEDVVDGGFGLAFIAYPEAVAHMPISTLWSILFFLMLLTLGLDSQFTIMETVVTALVDEFPDQLRKRKTWVMLCACIIGYFLGFTCITEAGPYWVSLIDSYAASFALLLFGICETIGLAWFYGVKRFTNDIRTMIGDGYVDFFLFKWWPLLWTAVTPAVLIFVVLFNFMNWTEPSYNGEYPTWARAIGWMMTMSSVIWIPIIMGFEFVRFDGGIKERWRLMTNPRPNWGPALQKHRNKAWKVHRRHGTTMGGKKYLPGEKPPPKTVSDKVEMEIADTGVDNQGFDAVP
ncbi:sodium- and chloride-dependent neutral and basic amino acid transporter B(0+)-like [Amphiura filiformis]|uniref:sodium- and chloride-dependent neutral and basic amino acid transporter B(0+)-like n=1 Tax=Amphiura filiformis TaxID=82378 RepID=UPI003B21A873